MSQFYAMQLKEAHKTIEKLRDENTRLRKEMNLLRLGEQSRLAELQQKLNEQRFNNQALKNQVDMTQMRIEMLSGGRMFSSQPVFPQRPNLAATYNPLNSENAQSSQDAIDPSIWFQYRLFFLVLMINNSFTIDWLVTFFFLFVSEESSE